MLTMKQVPLAIVLLISLAALALNASADYWSSSVDTNSSHWYIYRQSSNTSFFLSSSVEGSVSPVEYHGRMLSPYQSYYEEIGANDVLLRQRTNSLKGIYRSTDEIKMQSSVHPTDEIEITIKKPAGTEIYTIEYKNEIWPVFLTVNRSLTYFGQQINNRDFEGNNGDFVGATFLYNQELFKEQRSVLRLQRMNATVLTTDDVILLAEFKPTKYLAHLVHAKTTGIADLSYRLRDPQYNVKLQAYPAISEGDERYYGRFDLTRKIENGFVIRKY